MHVLQNSTNTEFVVEKKRLVAVAIENFRVGTAIAYTEQGTENKTASAHGLEVTVPLSHQRHKTTALSKLTL